MARRILADGSEVTFDVYGVTVVWDGQPKYVETAAVGIDALVGMMLLDRQSLFVEVAAGVVSSYRPWGDTASGQEVIPARYIRAGSQVVHA